MLNDMLQRIMDDACFFAENMLKIPALLWSEFRSFLATPSPNQIRHYLKGMSWYFHIPPYCFRSPRCGRPSVKRAGIVYSPPAYGRISFLKYFLRLLLLPFTFVNQIFTFIADAFIKPGESIAVIVTALFTSPTQRLLVVYLFGVLYYWIPFRLLYYLGAILSLGLLLTCLSFLIIRGLDFGYFITKKSIWLILELVSFLGHQVITIVVTIAWFLLIRPIITKGFSVYHYFMFWKIRLHYWLKLSYVLFIYRIKRTNVFQFLIYCRTIVSVLQKTIILFFIFLFLDLVVGFLTTCTLLQDYFISFKS